MDSDNKEIILQFLAQSDIDEINRAFFTNFINKNHKIVNINHEPACPILNFLKIVEFISQTDYDLKALDLSNAKLGLEGSQLVANIMSQNNIIQTLNLSGAKLGPEGGPSGLKLISTSLKTNTALQNLILASIKCSLAGAAALASLLTNNKTIRYLGLQGCKIGGNMGIDVLICSLKFNTGLIKLDLDQFHYDNVQGNDKLVESILIALQTNEVIEEIILSYNSANYDLLFKLQAKLDSNKSSKK